METAVNSRRSAGDVHHVVLVDYGSHVAAVALVLDYSHSGQESQHRGNSQFSGSLVYTLGGVGVDRKRRRPADLPVEIQRGLIHRYRGPEHHVRKSEQICKAGVFLAGFHHADVRNEHSRNIEARKLHAVLILAYLLKDTCRDAFRGLSVRVAGEHSVDIRVVEAPEPLSDIRSVTVYRRYYQYLPVVGDIPLTLKSLQRFDKLTAHIELLYLVSAKRTYNTAGLFALAEAVARHSEIIAVRRRQTENDVLFHSKNLTVIYLSLLHRADVISVCFHAVYRIDEIREPRETVISEIEALESLLELYAQRSYAVASLGACELVDELLDLLGLLREFIADIQLVVPDYYSAYLSRKLSH